MPAPKIGVSPADQPMHFSAGALIKADGKYLIIHRTVPPICFAGVAGHIDEGEFPLQAVIREVHEETGATLVHPILQLEEFVPWNWCNKGITGHYWHLFTGQIIGQIFKNTQEASSIGWYTPDQIKQLYLEPVWKYWFEKLKIIY